MKPWIRWIGTGVGLLLFVYFLHFVYETYKTYELNSLFRIGLLFGVFVAGLICALLVPISGLAWSILLRSMGSNWRITRLTAIIGFTQLAKYIPGNVAQHISRTTVALIDGIPPTILFISVLAESLLLLTASLFIGLICVSLSPTKLPTIAIPFADTPWFFSIFLILPALLLPVALRFVANLLYKFAYAKETTHHTLPMPTAVAALQVFSLYCAAYLLLGIALWLITYFHGGLVQVDIFTLTASFALAWLAGYLAPGAPAGLGVREGAMAILLANSGPSEYILTIIIASRVATFFADMFSFILSALFIRLNKDKISA